MRKTLAGEIWFKPKDRVVALRSAHHVVVDEILLLCEKRDFEVVVLIHGVRVPAFTNKPIKLPMPIVMNPDTQITFGVGNKPSSAKVQFRITGVMKDESD